MSVPVDSHRISVGPDAVDAWNHPCFISCAAARCAGLSRRPPSSSTYARSGATGAHSSRNPSAAVGVQRPPDTAVVEASQRPTDERTIPSRQVSAMSSRVHAIAATGMAVTFSTHRRLRATTGVRLCRHHQALQHDHRHRCARPAVTAKLSTSEGEEMRQCAADRVEPLPHRQRWFAERAADEGQLP
jgi:hypothetical protein